MSHNTLPPTSKTPASQTSTTAPTQVRLDLRDRPAQLSNDGRTPVIDLVESGRRATLLQAGGEGIASLVRRANHDELTGLANRSWFVTAVDRCRSKVGPACPGALFLIDLDGFKAVNDTWGHDAGDTVLREVARRLGHLTASGALAARLGGDEFALWVPDCPAPQGSLVADRIIARISEPIAGKVSLSVGASVGWVLAEDTSSVSSLLSRADVAMYASKEGGGHRHHRFDRKLASQQVRGRVLQREIRHGMTVGQFVLAQQPIVDIDGSTIGHEMLARWRHPRRGLLHPAEFLGAVGSAGNAAEFDTYVLRRSIENLQQASTGSTIWVNLTADSLNNATVSRLRDAMITQGVKPSQLVLEISEHASAESPAASQAIEEIAAMGYGVAIDDFGSGYSRLGAMATLPITHVKIDQQFIASIDVDVSAERLCGAIVDLIHAIGAKAVAEGIERLDQAHVLKRLGCEYFQGFYFGRPALEDSENPESNNTGSENT